MAELDIEKLKSCTAIKQIPILTLDERWYHLITDKLKTDEICYWEKQVNELLKKQGQVNNDIKEVKKIKNQLIQDVVDNMQDDDNDPKRAKVMEKNQRLIQEAKDKINSIPYEKKLIDEEKPFRRVDGNHRLQAMEQLVSTGQISSTYLIPFCLILFADTDSLKDEKVIFHNINSKAVPLKSEQLLKSVLIQQHDGLDFNDRELIEKFGPEYLLARKILSANPLTVRKLGYIEWIHPRILSTLVDLINYVQEKSGTRIETLEQQEALINSLNNTLRHAHPLGAAKLQMASGLLFLLVYMYYQMENGELDPQNKAEKEKNQLIAWAEKYNITDAQHDIEQYAAVNADCIRAIFDKYVLSTEQTIFMSRCFDSRFDENERAIRRAIEYVNREKGSSLRLLRVDQHSEGATGQISDRILRDIEMSGLVIADLSSGRANIPHEIGFAMGLKKGLILIHNGTDAEADEHTPSNIKMYEQIRFNQDYHKLETELKAKLIDYYKL